MRGGGFFGEAGDSLFNPQGEGSTTGNPVDVLQDMDRPVDDAAAYRAAAESKALKWADVAGKEHVSLQIEDGGEELLFLKVADVATIPAALPKATPVSAWIYGADGKVQEGPIFLEGPA